jgi:transposase
MSQNFIAVDREQALLLPPDVRDWLPEDHLAWFVLDAVAGMDLSAFYAAYRRDGWGCPAYDPAMMVALCSTRARALSGSLRSGSSVVMARMWLLPRVCG